MGEGMSRRMMKEGLKSGVTGGTMKRLKKRLKRVMSVELPLLWRSLCSSRHEQEGMVGPPGIFQLVIPAELVEDTLNELLPLLGDGDIIIDHGNSNFKDSRRRAERLAKMGIQYLDCGTSGGVYGLERGYCLMVGGASVQQYLSVPPFSGHSHQGLVLQPAQTHTLAQLVLNTVGYTVVDLVQDTLSRWSITV